MNFQKKIVLSTVVLVFLLTLLSTTASCLLIWHQIQQQQTERLTNSFNAVQLRILSSIPLVEDQYRSFINHPTTRSIQEIPPKAMFTTADMVGLLTYYPDVREYLIVFGKIQDVTNYALYLPNDPSSGQGSNPSDDRHLYLQYIAEKNGVIVGGNQLFKWDPRNFLMKETIARESFFPATLSDIPPMALVKFPGGSGVEASYPIGKAGILTLQREWDFSLERQEADLGTVINIYDRKGQIIDGQTVFLDLKKHIPVQAVKETLFTSDELEDFTTIIAPIKYHEEVIGYLSVGISQQLTHNSIKKTILLFGLIGVLVTMFVLSLAIPLTQSFVRPIGILVEECGVISSGNLNHNINTNRTDELGTLALSFSSMRDSVKEKIADLSRLTTILDTTRDLVCVTLPDHSIIYMNRAGRELLGWPEEEKIEHKSFYDIYPKKIHKIIEYKHLPTAIQAGLWEGETLISGADNHEIQVSQVIMYHSSEDGKPEHISTIIRDISQSKKDEDERKKLESQLRQSQKMEAIGQLTGGVAHDFNNLLQVILGFSELAKQDSLGNQSIEGYLDEVTRAGNSAKTLVGQMLAFSRRQVLELTDLDLNDVITDLMNMLRRIIGEHISLEIKPGHDLGIIRADQGQMVQILTNLCVNAHDAMPDGGTITIETKNVTIDHDFPGPHLSVTPGRYILISVTDTGCGMSKETIDQIFEPFFTTKELGRGTGLGLATVYGLVQQHQGSINAYSEPDKGTIFEIYLPVAEQAAAGAASRPETPAKGGTETILVAEDDTMVLGLCQNILEGAGYTVLQAVDGEQALTMFKNNAHRIDLVMLDVVMPQMGGREVFDQIRLLHPEVKIFFASGYSTSAIHTNFVLDEGLVFIQKPYQRKDLLRKVREILDQA